MFFFFNRRTLFKHISWVSNFLKMEKLLQFLRYLNIICSIQSNLKIIYTCSVLKISLILPTNVMRNAHSLCVHCVTSIYHRSPSRIVAEASTLFSFFLHFVATLFQKTQSHWPYPVVLSLHKLPNVVARLRLALIKAPVLQRDAPLHRHAVCRVHRADKRRRRPVLCRPAQSPQHWCHLQVQTLQRGIHTGNTGKHQLIFVYYQVQINNSSQE